MSECPKCKKEMRLCSLKYHLKNTCKEVIKEEAIKIKQEEEERIKQEQIKQEEIKQDKPVKKVVKKAVKKVVKEPETIQQQQQQEPQKQTVTYDDVVEEIHHPQKPQTIPLSRALTRQDRMKNLVRNALP
jgi:ethanolamine utilization protein EutQ (cupin superfamily)